MLLGVCRSQNPNYNFPFKLELGRGPTPFFATDSTLEQNIPVPNANANGNLIPHRIHASSQKQQNYYCCEAVIMEHTTTASYPTMPVRKNGTVNLWMIVGSLDHVIDTIENSSSALAKLGRSTVVFNDAT